MQEELIQLQAYYNDKKYQDAEALARNLLEKNPTLNHSIILLDFLSKTLRMQAKFDAALKVFNSLVLLLENADTNDENNAIKLGYTLQNIALLESQNKNFLCAMDNAQKAVDTFEKLFLARKIEESTLANALIVLSSVFYDRNALQEAENTVTRALNVLRTNAEKNEFLISTCLNNLGRIYEHYEDYTKANTVYEEAIFIRKKIDAQSIDTAFCLGNYGASLAACKNFAKGIEVLEESIKIYTMHGLGESDFVKSHKHNLALCRRALGEAL